MAQPNGLAVGGLLQRLLVGNAVLVVLLVGGEGEGHAADVTTFDGTQQLVGGRRLCERTTNLQTALVDFKGERTLALPPATEDELIVVESSQHNVGATEQVGGDTTRLHDLVHLTLG